jgi:hypothetical protein
MRRAWRSLHPSAEEIAPPPPAFVDAEPLAAEPAAVAAEPLAEPEPEPVLPEPEDVGAETPVAVPEPSPDYVEHAVGDTAVLLPEVEEPEPEVAIAVEEFAADREPAPVPSPRTRGRWAAAAATAALLCGAGAVAAVSWAVWGSDDGGNDEAAEATSRSRGAAILAAVSDKSAKRIPVAGSRGKLLLVVASDGRAVLVVSGLQRAPKGKQFEAWVITGETARRAGLFSGGPGYIVVPLTRPVPKGATVAVTLERLGGVEAPTNQPLFAAKRA